MFSIDTGFWYGIALTAAAVAIYITAAWRLAKKHALKEHISSPDSI